MKYAPTVARHRTLDPHRTKRHMLKSTADHLTLPEPLLHEETVEFRTKFETWVQKWSALHNDPSPMIHRTTSRGYVHFTITHC